MQYRPLGRSGINVSALALGTMTFGSQNSESESHALIDRAVDAGVTLIDTAEMYPTTPRALETTGRTEEFIGSWILNSGRRDDIILASKVTGAGYSLVRDGAPISPDTIRTALNGSLKRLRTDVIDLYQIHWPNRGSYHFRQSFIYNPSKQQREETLNHIGEVLETLDELVRAGKIRYVGLSNETCWGVSQYLDIAARHNQVKVVSIQNEYSLLCRLFDLDMAELSHHEDIGLLAYSPLAAGLLSGKYQGDARPQGSRRAVNPDLGGRLNDHSIAAVDAYLAVARKHGLDPCQMALAFCLSRPFMAAVIFGATTMTQLDNALAAADLELDDDTLVDIEDVHRLYPIPM